MLDRRHLSGRSSDQRCDTHHEGQAGRHARRKRNLATWPLLVAALSFIGSLLTILACSLQIISLEAGTPTTAKQPASASPKNSSSTYGAGINGWNGDKTYGEGSQGTPTNPPSTSPTRPASRQKRHRHHRPPAACTSSATRSPASTPETVHELPALGG